MYKSKRLLATFFSTCLCFFLMMLLGNFATATNKNTAPSAVQEIPQTAENIPQTVNVALQTAEETPQTAKHTLQTAKKILQAGKDTLQTAEKTAQTVNLILPDLLELSLDDLEETQLFSVDTAAQSSNTEENTVTPTPAPVRYTTDKAIANVTEYVNIRERASSDSTLLGRLFENGVATVLGTEGDWTKVQTGSMTGYIFSDYLYLGEASLSYGDSIGAYNVVVTANSLNVRTEPTTDGAILATVSNGDSFRAKLEDSYEDWIAIQYDANTVGYVYAEYVALKCTLKQGVTLEEEAAAAKAAKIEKSKINTIPITYRNAISVSEEEEYLLATLIAMEAEYEPYEGKLAVANVVVNRLLSGYWGDSITDVIYAPGQFSGADSGRVERFQSKGFNKDCYKAAEEALSGKNNIGEFLFFHAAYYVEQKDTLQTFTSWHQIGGHIFFQR